MLDPSERTAVAESEPGVELEKIVDELREEVRRLKSSGQIPAGYEQQLADAYRKLVPSKGTDVEMVKALQAVGAATLVRGEIPIQDSPGMSTYVKRLVRKMVAWYMNFIANQVSMLGDSTFEALRLLASRYEGLVHRLEVSVPDEVVAQASARRVLDLQAWTGFVVEVMRGRKGRVLHMSAGSGEILDALVGEGIDVYGVEPWEEKGEELIRRGLDVWTDDPLTHLRQVGDGRLGGLVLTGFVDGKVPGTIWEMVRVANQKLEPGAPLVVIAATRESWTGTSSSVLADLAPGHPLGAETWALLLTAAGFSGVRSLEDAEGQMIAVTGVRES